MPRHRGSKRFQQLMIWVTPYLVTPTVKPTTCVDSHRLAKGFWMAIPRSEITLGLERSNKWLWRWFNFYLNWTNHLHHWIGNRPHQKASVIPHNYFFLEVEESVLPAFLFLPVIGSIDWSKRVIPFLAFSRHFSNFESSNKVTHNKSGSQQIYRYGL